MCSKELQILLYTEILNQPLTIWKIFSSEYVSNKKTINILKLKF